MDDTVNGLTFSDSVHVAATPEEVYDVVSDVTRTGEWSPICVACWWEDESVAGQEGAWFGGRNETPDRTWETRSLVDVADRGREFAWLVGGKLVRWSFSMSPAPGGTTLTESWHFRPEGLAFFADKYGDRAQEQVEERTRAAHHGIPETLAAIKRVVEGA